MCVCVCARARARARACVCRSACVLNRSHERTALAVAWDLIPGDLLTFSTPLSHDIWKNEIRNDQCENSLCLSNTFYDFFCWYSKGTGRDFGEVRKGTRAVHGWYLESLSGDLKRERGGLDLG